MEPNHETPTSPYEVHVAARTWARDSHDLFDFEATQLATTALVVPKNMKCIRVGSEVQTLDEHAPVPQGAEQLLRFVRKDGIFWVDKASSASSSRKLWLVVRDLPSSSQRLSRGDVIKLGRFKFRVHQTVAEESGIVKPDLKFSTESSAVCCVDSGNVEMQSAICRICLLEGSSDEDPLIKPCKCKGSIEHVHLGCLRYWIKGRHNYSDSPTSFFYKPMACELCKSIYPTYIRGLHGCEEPQPLAEVPQLPGPFIVLENLVRDSHQHSGHGLHVVSLADSKTLRFGRGHESDVRIADVSISRRHAAIRFQDGNFIIEDLNSKFGTLIASKKPRPLQPNVRSSIQVGRTVLNLSVQPRGTAVAEQPLPGVVEQLHGADAPPAQGNGDPGAITL